MTQLVIGADIGGTSTRVGVADLSGRILSLARGGPGNPNSVGLEGSAREIREATERALAPLDGEVVKTVIGLAGGSGLSGDESFLSATVPASVRQLPVLVSDFAVAFCAGTPARAGYVVIAGTGAGACSVADDDLVERRDGWGWLLGDDGSGFWIGRAAVRATLVVLQQQAAPGPLARAVLAATECNNLTDLVAVCYQRPPTWLAQFSTLVSQSVETDPSARAIAIEAAELLTRSVLSLDPRPDQPIVLGGSVLTQPGPISDIFARQLTDRLANPVLRSHLGVVGALWMAVRDLVKDDSRVHAQLLADADNWV